MGASFFGSERSEPEVRLAVDLERQSNRSIFWLRPRLIAGLDHWASISLRTCVSTHRTLGALGRNNPKSVTCVREWVHLYLLGLAMRYKLICVFVGSLLCVPSSLAARSSSHTSSGSHSSHTSGGTHSSHTSGGSHSSHASSGSHSSHTSSGSQSSGYSTGTSGSVQRSAEVRSNAVKVQRTPSSARSSLSSERQQIGELLRLRDRPHQAFGVRRCGCS